VVIHAAAVGELPDWAVVSRHRIAHMERVATLMEEWATALKLPADERARWKAAGFLHDALREAPPEQLRSMVPPVFRHLAGKLLHGPAAAERLRQDGLDDEAFLRAVAYHTIGHPELDDLGRALFIADYIEPGRKYEPARLAALRSRMPQDRAGVLREVLHARMENLLNEGRPLRAETAAFWNVVNGAGDAAPKSSGGRGGRTDAGPRGR
jgi:predicted HD superfamily hydrolase involved in NAD metabolism